MGISKGSVCPLMDGGGGDNTVFVIRKHGSERVFSPRSKANSLSRQTSVNSYQSKSNQASRLTLDEDLESLRAANIIFIRHVQVPRRGPSAKKLPPTQNKYTIVNTCGETLFYAVEVKTLADEIESTSPSKPVFSSEEDGKKLLKFAVVNSQGEEVFDIQGHGTYAAVRRDSTVLGNVAQTNRVSSCRQIPPSYLIESEDGRTLQKIEQQPTWRKFAKGFLPVNDFNVLSPDGTICKAKISRQTNAITLEEYSQTDTYALSFHTTDMDGKMKALIVAAVLMLDFQLTEKTNEFRDYKSLLLRILFCAFLVFTLIALIIVVADSAVEFQKEKVKRFPGQVPPP